MKFALQRTGASNRAWLTRTVCGSVIVIVMADGGGSLLARRRTRPRLCAERRCRCNRSSSSRKQDRWWRPRRLRAASVGPHWEIDFPHPICIMSGWAPRGRITISSMQRSVASSCSAGVATYGRGSFLRRLQHATPRAWVPAWSFSECKNDCRGHSIAAHAPHTGWRALPLLAGVWSSRGVDALAVVVSGIRATTSEADAAPLLYARGDWLSAHVKRSPPLPLACPFTPQPRCRAVGQYDATSTAATSAHPCTPIRSPLASGGPACS